MAKQTGPAYGVKGWFIRLVGCAALLAVTACASTWHNPRKSPEEARADERMCAERAEETALLRASRQRVDYGRPKPTSVPGMNRGETPMEMVDRKSTENSYQREFEMCMKTKGYSQGNDEKR